MNVVGEHGDDNGCSEFYPPPNSEYHVSTPGEDGKRVEYKTLPQVSGWLENHGFSSQEGGQLEDKFIRGYLMDKGILVKGEDGNLHLAPGKNLGDLRQGIQDAKGEKKFEQAKEDGSEDSWRRVWDQQFKDL
ncbi:MAG: hypothetical protein HC848_10025 [Limnobacter sp.]|nr:hypothetical protein [Limnobacter sp.]